jgi:hypothetical protein
LKSFLHLRSVRVATALAIASGFAGTVGLVATTTPVTQAGADPTSTTALVGVGADVSEDLYNALAGEAPNPGPGVTPIFYTPLHSSAATNSVTLASFDANPQGGTTLTPGQITTKTSGPAFDRPNSSSAGTLALDDSVTGNPYNNTTSDSIGPVVISGQVDFARTAKGVTNAGSDLTWIPFARDALGILYYNDGTAPSSPVKLTASQLAALYTSSTGKAVINGVTVYACLPISTSSPVSNLAKTLGISSTAEQTAATAAGCNGTAQNIQQNSGNSFVAGLPAGASYAVIPISSGSWIGQANGVGYDRSATARADGVDLADITNASSVDLGQPYTVVAGKEKPSTTYYQDSAWGYNLSTVVPTSKISGFRANAAIEDLFVGASSELCSSTGQDAQATVNLFGFDTLSGSEGTCGSITTEGDS